LGYGPVQKLSAADSVESFDCAQPALNQFLQRYAMVNQKTGSAQTYVCCKNGEVVGFYSLTVGSVEHEEAPQRVVKGLAHHPVPVMLLAHLAVDKGHQGKGIGRALLKDALLRTLQVSDIREWYTEWEFEPSPTNPFHLFLMLKDLKAIVGK
jgi:GNAT superfamily N-acetyltransferase